MKIHTISKRFKSSGFTLIEMSLVIALMLGLIAIVFLGIGSYRKGASKAQCKMQLAAVQKAVRAQSNFQNLAIGAPFTAAANAFGPGKALENVPICPTGGVYTWGTVIPALNQPYGQCNYTDPDGVTTHVLLTGATAPTDTRDW